MLSMAGSVMNAPPISLWRISAVVGCAGALAPRPAKSSLIEMASSTSPTPARISAFCQA